MASASFCPTGVPAVQVRATSVESRHSPPASSSLSPLVEWSGHSPGQQIDGYKYSGWYKLTSCERTEVERKTMARRTVNFIMMTEKVTRNERLLLIKQILVETRVRRVRQADDTNKVV